MKFNPVHSDKDLSLIKLMFGGLGNDYQIVEELPTSHEVDFFPKVKFREVSALEIKLRKMDKKDLFNMASDLSLIGEKNKIFSQCKSDDEVMVLIHAFKWLYRYYGENTWVIFNSSLKQAQNRTQITKIKWIKDSQRGTRWSICWLPSVEKVCPATFKFLCQFFYMLQRSGIGDYVDGQYDMMKDLFPDHISVLQDEIEHCTGEHKKQAKLMAKVANEEFWSYKNGEPKRIAEAIAACKMNPKTILSCFDEWIVNYTIFVPDAVVEEIREFCEIMSHGIQISDFEKHVNSHEENSPLPTYYGNVLCWDDGVFEEYVAEYINSNYDNNGAIELGDSINLTIYGKDNFTEQGHLMERFLNLWYNNKIFHYFYENFKHVTSKSDGARICNRSIQASTRQQNKPVRRTSQNRKQTVTSR